MFRSQRKPMNFLIYTPRLEVAVILMYHLKLDNVLLFLAGQSCSNAGWVDAFQFLQSCAMLQNCQIWLSQCKTGLMHHLR